MPSFPPAHPPELHSHDVCRVNAVLLGHPPPRQRLLGGARSGQLVVIVQRKQPGAPVGKVAEQVAIVERSWSPAWLSEYSPDRLRSLSKT